MKSDRIRKQGNFNFLSKLVGLIQQLKIGPFSIEVAARLSLDQVTITSYMPKSQIAVLI